MREITGWLLDAYTPEGEAAGGEAAQMVTLWLLGEDGQRHRLQQPFPVTFYAAGPTTRLRELWRYLERHAVSVRLERAERRDLFSERPLTVLVVRVLHPGEQPRLFRDVSNAFPDLTYFDADIQLTLRHAAAHGTFPLARCRVMCDEAGLVQEIRTLDSAWDLDPEPAPLRVLSLEPDCDPSHAEPQHLLISCERSSYRLAFEPARPFLINLRAILKRHDPDLLLSTWGDTWLLPRLLEMAEAAGFDLPLNRDPACQASHRPERTYFSYGQVIYRGRQVHLFGRWHIDRQNAMLWHDYELDGVLEIARVTALPVQTAARVSPGTGISSMQILTALRLGILVPWHKQQAEYAKPAADLFASDQGGLVYQPLIGLHRDVAAIDFISMYPGIMVRFNISPETVGPQRADPLNLSALETPPYEELKDGGGLVPQTLAPLLDKRIELKTRLAEMPAWEPRRRRYKAGATAHKWLLVTCFGYLGYKNARFGRIEAHEAVTAYGREALIRAKEAAEDLGFTVLHMYVDGLWVKRPGACAVADFQPLLDAIAERTRLPIALDGIYRWVAFLPSRLDERQPVANRYFGVFQDGSLKMRGIEVRRRDTPRFVGETQLELLDLLVRQTRRAWSPGDGQGPHLPGHLLAPAVALVRRKLAQLRAGRVPLESLLVKQRLSRALEEYRVPSPAARAAGQLQAVDKQLRAGQSVRFLYTLGEPGVYAWNLPEPPNPDSVDAARYTELLLRAAAAVLEPFGMSENELRWRVLAGALPLRLPLPRPRRRLAIKTRQVLWTLDQTGDLIH